jgi:uncharacterized protein YggU (UPF0235/DUF167 family)
MITQRIKVKPASFKDEVLIDEKGDWTVKIRAKPIDGEANVYLVNYLSKQFNINKSAINIEKGTGNQYKSLSINISIAEFDKVRVKPASNWKPCTSQPGSPCPC